MLLSGISNNSGCQKLSQISGAENAYRIRCPFVNYYIILKKENDLKNPVPFEKRISSKAYLHCSLFYIPYS